MNIKKLLLTVLFITLGTYSNLFAQANDVRIKNIEATFPVIEAMMSDYSKECHLPGLAYGLVVDGKLIHTGNQGYSNISQNIFANSKSAFRIASMTKSFTAMAILKLRDESKLKLDDPAYLYIPEMKEIKYLSADAHPITISNLLTHTAGFPEDNPWGDRQLATTDDQLISMIKKGISFSSNPGTTFEYSNMGYAMLGYIIKRVSGQSYQNYITKNILLPLGMTHTYWEYDDVPKKDLAKGYRWLNNQWQEQPMLHDGTYGAMGGLITTIEDFAKYMSFYLSASPPSNDQDNGPVKRSSVRELQYPWNFIQVYDKSNSKDVTCPSAAAYCYGLGWVKDCKNIVSVGHSGGLPGFGSNWRILPGYGIGIVSFSNLTYAPMNKINTQILDKIIDLAKLQPEKLPTSAILNQRKNELINLLPAWKNPEASPVFAENFFLDYSIDSLRKEAKTIFNNAGKITNVQELIPENNLRGSFVMEGEKSDIEISFTLTPENPPLIQEYHIIERVKK
ncbi:serine hydrolase domain-containing protein [Flavobacterium sp.]|uniref:serine hydrolase domain-containing protein n=1 Tax=Flavobacterium sp. TaxID=239 RepID=UPI002D7EF86E|nr:serine hydrolase domain-containing protein [Flavobacterium sp.]